MHSACCKKQKRQTETEQTKLPEKEFGITQNHTTESALSKMTHCAQSHIIQKANNKQILNIARRLPQFLRIRYNVARYVAFVYVSRIEKILSSSLKCMLETNQWFSILYANFVRRKLNSATLSQRTVCVFLFTRSIAQCSVGNIDTTH